MLNFRSQLYTGAANTQSHFFLWHPHDWPVSVRFGMRNCRVWQIEVADRHIVTHQKTDPAEPRSASTLPRSPRSISKETRSTREDTTAAAATADSSDLSLEMGRSGAVAGS